MLSHIIHAQFEDKSSHHSLSLFASLFVCLFVYFWRGGLLYANNVFKKEKKKERKKKRKKATNKERQKERKKGRKKERKKERKE